MVGGCGGLDEDDVPARGDGEVVDAAVHEAGAVNADDDVEVHKAGVAQADGDVEIHDAGVAHVDDDAEILDAGAVLYTDDDDMEVLVANAVPC